MYRLAVGAMNLDRREAAVRVMVIVKCDAEMFEVICATTPTAASGRLYAREKDEKRHEGGAENQRNDTGVHIECMPSRCAALRFIRHRPAPRGPSPLPHRRSRWASVNSCGIRN